MFLLIELTKFLQFSLDLFQESLDIKKFDLLLKLFLSLFSSFMFLFFRFFNIVILKTKSRFKNSQFIQVNFWKTFHQLIKWYENVKWLTLFLNRISSKSACHDWIIEDQSSIIGGWPLKLICTWKPSISDWFIFY